MTGLVTFSDVIGRIGTGPQIEIADTEFRQGGLHVIVGANGSGKSTFLKLMLGFALMTRGRIEWRIDGSLWTLGPRAPLPDSFYQHVGYVQQGSESLWPQFDVFEHIERAVIHRRARLGLADRAAVHAYVENVLDQVRISPDKWRRRVYSSSIDGTAQGLSGGERQRVSFGRSIAARPSVLVLDELEAALDSETQSWLIKDFLRAYLAPPERTAFVVTHDPALWTDGGDGLARTLWRTTKFDDRISVTRA
jgi:ABC-type multidrug transport system ATPase subunit